MPRGGARKGSGPKPRPLEEHRAQAIRAWVTPAELELIQDQRREGESMSDCIRRIALWYVSAGVTIHDADPLVSGGGAG